MPIPNACEQRRESPCGPTTYNNLWPHKVVHADYGNQTKLWADSGPLIWILYKVALLIKDEDVYGSMAWVELLIWHEW